MFSSFTSVIVLINVLISNTSRQMLRDIAYSYFMDLHTYMCFQIPLAQQAREAGWILDIRHWIVNNELTSVEIASCTLTFKIYKTEKSVIMITISSRLEGEYSILNSVANKRPRSKLDEVTCWEFNLQKPNVHLYINSQPVWNSTLHDVANNKPRSYFEPT